MRHPRIAALGGAVIGLCVVMAGAGCAPAADADKRAAFQLDLETEKIDGVVYASETFVVLDITESPDSIAATAVEVRELFEARDPDSALALRLARQGVASSETEFSINDVGEHAQHFEEQVALWAGIVTSGFAGVRMSLFGEGSEYGEGVISVAGWYGPGDPPAVGDTFYSIVERLDEAGLTPSLMQVNVDLDIKILCDDTSLPIADGLFETFERVESELKLSFASISIGPKRAAISVGRVTNGERVPLSADEVSRLLAEFDAAGLLTDSLFIADVSAGTDGPALWGARL